MKDEKKGTSKTEMLVDTDGTKRWYLNGKYHREDGPAIEHTDGSKQWWNKGRMHREDGPAYEGANGRREWFINGQSHRIDGPAVEDPEGFDEFWLNGVQYSHHSFQEFVKKVQAAQPIKKPSADPVKKIEKELEEFTDHQLEKLAKVVNRIKTQRKLIVSLNPTSKKPKI